MPYIGRDLNRGNYLKLDDISSSFNSSTKTFNLTVGGSAFTPGSAFSILVSVGGVIQEPESAYQVNNSEITFANAPTAQDSFFCLALGVPIGIGVPGNGTVNGTQMAKPFNYDGYFHLDDANNRVGINSSIPTVALDVIGNIKLNGNLVTGSGGGGLKGNVYAASGISTFNDVRVTNNLTVEGTTTTLDTNLIGVDRVEVGANSNSIVGMAVTQSGTADILNLYDGSTEVFSVADGGKVDILATNNLLTLKKAANSNYCGFELDRDNSGTEGGTIGLAGGTGHFITSASQHDLTIRSANGNILFGNGQTEVLRTNPSGAKVTGILTATTFVGNGDFVDIDVDGRADLDDVVITGVTTATNMVEISGSSFDNGGVLTLRNTSAINNDENIANINIAANDGPSGFHTGAQIKFQSGNNWSDGATWTDIIFKHAKRASGTALVNALKIAGTTTNVSTHIAIGSSALSNAENYYLAIRGYERSSEGATGDAVNIGIINQSGSSTATSGIDFRLGQAAVSNTAAVRLIAGKTGGWTNTASTRDGYFKISVAQNAQPIDRFTIRSNGNTGIGTMLPDTSLHILSSSTGLKVQRGNEYFSVNADYGGQSHCAFELTNALSIRTGSGAQNERFRITNDGKVGIGTDDPQKLLELEHVANRKLQFSYDDNTVTIKSSNNNGNPENLRFIGDDLIFHTGTSGSASQSFRIDDNGNVSIHSAGYGGGGAAPQLYVRGTGGRQVKIHNSSAGTSMLQITNGTTGEGEDAGTQLFTQATTGDFHIRNHFETGDIAFATKASGGSTTDKLRVKSDGLITMDNTTAQICMRDSGVVDNAIFYIGGGTRTQTSTTTDFTQICLYDKNSQYNTQTAGGSWKSKIKFFAAQMNGGAREGAFVGQDTTYNNFSGSTTKMRSDLIFGTRGDAQTSSSDPATEKLRIRHDGLIQYNSPSAVTAEFNTSSSSGAYHDYKLGASGARIGYIGAGSQLVSGSAVSDFGFRSTGNIVFSTGGSTERLRINSSGNLKLPDGGEIQFGGALNSGNGDLRIYHDSTNSLNLITAGSNLPIKISGGVQFYDYTGVTKRAHLDSNGFRIGSVSAPSLPQNGKEPMIMRNETYFTKEIHRTISDYRSICDGTHAGYLLLIPAHPGSGNVDAKKFYGTVMCDRGGTTSGNSTQFATVHATTSYSNDKFYVEIDRHSQYICGASKVTYSGTDYLALRFNNGGGGPHAGIHIDGIHRGTDANFLRLLRENEVTVVDKHYGALATNPSGPPICGAFVSHMTGSTYDSGALANGNIRYQYAPSGQSSPYNNSNGRFTARVNGLYLVTGGVLVASGTGRLEGKLEWYDGNQWQTWVNFNGTGTTYDGPTFTCMIPLKEGYHIRIGRNSGNAYDPTHSNHYFGVHLLNALRRDDVTI